MFYLGIPISAMTPTLPGATRPLVFGILNFLAIGATTMYPIYKCHHSWSNC